MFSFSADLSSRFSRLAFFIFIWNLNFEFYIRIILSKGNKMHFNLLWRVLLREKKMHLVLKAKPVTPKILHDIQNFLNYDYPFDAALWCLFLLILFLMATKSNMVPNSVYDFDAKRKLIGCDITMKDDLLILSKARHFGRSRDISLSNIPGSCLCPVPAFKHNWFRISCQLGPCILLLDIKVLYPTNNIF